MNGRPEPKVLLMQLSERTSAKGTRYLSGFLDQAKLVAFLDQEPDRFGNPQWSVYASEPAPRVDQAAGDGTAGAGNRAAGAGSGFLHTDNGRARAGGPVTVSFRTGTRACVHEREGGHGD